MNKILIAVDGTKGTQDMFAKIVKICKCMSPEEIILLYVEKLEGSSLMDDMLGEAELSTLREELEGTEFKKALDTKADKILGYYKNLLQNKPPTPEVRTVIRSGHPAEEIINGAKEEGADLIIIGTRGKRVGRLFIGSVSSEVANNAAVPVLLVR
jgi:nucleotide-binding universal stress UspA family protein